MRKPKLLITLVSALAVSVAALPAQADRGGDWHGGRGDYRGGERYEHHEHHGGGRDNAWAGLAVFGALAGLAIMADNSRPVYAEPQYVQPVYPTEPVYVQPAPVYAPPAPASSGTWYYCESSRMYYPYTRACPEGWMAVPARPY